MKREVTMRTMLTGLMLVLATGAASAAPRGVAAPGEGGRLFVSPMGEPFRAVRGERDPEDAWFAGADTDHDGRITAGEFEADAMRFFAVLDAGHDGEIDPADIDHYENDLLPEIRVGSRVAVPREDRSSGHGMGGQGMGQGMHFGNGGSPRPRDPALTERRGAARYGLLDLPEPVIAADANGNRGVSADEFRAAARARFALLDRNHDGRLTRSELPRVSAEARVVAPRERPRRAAGDDAETE